MNTHTLGIGKPFTWSYSKLKNFDTCPRRHYEIDIMKRVKEEETDTLRWGNEVHKHMAARLGDKTPLPFAFKHFEPLAVRLEAVPGKLLVEQKLAIKEDFSPCGYFDNGVWFRVVADVLIVDPPVALVIDYKTGKILEDYHQLALTSACVFAHHSDVFGVRSEAWWVREDAITKEIFKRRNMEDIWRQLWPRIEQLKHAHNTGVYPPKPSGLCRKYCPVVGCEYYQKGG